MSRYNQSYGGGKASTQNYNRNTSQYQYGKKSKAEAQLSSTELKLMKGSFDMFDLDGKGTISQDEFKATLRCLAYTVSDEEIAEMIKAFDTNSDGVMDFNEFLSMVKYLKSTGHQYGKEAFKKEIQHAFSVLDADGDGYLTPAELRYVLCNTGNKLRPSEINDFIKIFDKDNDGRVSCKELINIMCSSLVDHMNQIIPLR